MVSVPRASGPWWAQTLALRACRPIRVPRVGVIRGRRPVLLAEGARVSRGRATRGTHFWAVPRIGQHALAATATQRGGPLGRGNREQYRMSLRFLLHVSSPILLPAQNIRRYNIPQSPGNQRFGRNCRRSRGPMHQPANQTDVPPRDPRTPSARTPSTHRSRKPHPVPRLPTCTPSGDPP
jgi:hypothetical protein